MNRVEQLTAVPSYSRLCTPSLVVGALVACTACAEGGTIDDAPPTAVGIFEDAPRPEPPTQSLESGLATSGTLLAVDVAGRLVRVSPSVGIATDVVVDEPEPDEPDQAGPIADVLCDAGTARWLRQAPFEAWSETYKAGLPSAAGSGFGPTEALGGFEGPGRYAGVTAAGPVVVDVAYGPAWTLQAPAFSPSVGGPVPRSVWPAEDGTLHAFGSDPATPDLWGVWSATAQGGALEVIAVEAAPLLPTNVGASTTMRAAPLGEGTAFVDVVEGRVRITTTGPTPSHTTLWYEASTVESVESFSNGARMGIVTSGPARISVVTFEEGGPTAFEVWDLPGEIDFDDRFFSRVMAVDRSQGVERLYVATTAGVFAFDVGSSAAAAGTLIQHDPVFQGGSLRGPVVRCASAP